MKKHRGESTRFTSVVQEKFACRLEHGGRVLGKEPRRFGRYRTGTGPEVGVESRDRGPMWEVGRRKVTESDLSGGAVCSEVVD